MISPKQRSPSPRELGYSMPAEWAPHRATWISWPHNLETWPTQLDRVREAWMRMIQALSRHEIVHVLVNDDATEAEVTFRLKTCGTAMENIKILKIPTVDVWMRDYGPTFVTRDQPQDPLGLNDWIFNGWGGKYRAYEQDDTVAREIARLLGAPMFEHPIVLEGGSIDVNGDGVCLTTEQCLLNKNRNPHLKRADIEQSLKDALGVAFIVWLGDGIAGDDTDGHIDDIARFVNSGTVACVVETDSTDENYAPLQENLERLKSWRDQRGGKLEVVTLPSPGAVVCAGTRLPASYANFYVANDIVLVPTFNHANDRQALGILSELFPTREVIGVECTDVVAGLGGIHCVTQQEPRTPSARA